MAREQGRGEFDRELEALRQHLVLMATRAERQLELALRSIFIGEGAPPGGPPLGGGSTPGDKIEEVIDADRQIDQDEVDIDHLAFLVLMRRQPVASDLRFIMLALKVVTDVERIGDLAANIARRSRELRGYRPVSLLEQLAQLSSRVQAALRQAIDAFQHRDVGAARSVILGDLVIDRLNGAVFAGIIAQGANDALGVARALALSSVSRYLERIGDHAKNIAEMVIYLVQGRSVRHADLDEDEDADGDGERDGARGRERDG